MLARLTRLITSLLLAGMLAPAAGAVTVINNGLAPPNPANVLTGGGDLVGEYFHIQNVGCDATVEVPCANPGAPTEVEGSGWAYGYTAEVHETSTLKVYNGSMTRLTARDQAQLYVLGREEAVVRAYDSSTVHVSAYTSYVELSDRSHLNMDDFSIDVLMLDDSTANFRPGSLAEGLFIYTTGSVLIDDGRFWRFNIGSSANVSVLGGLVGVHGHVIKVGDTSTVSFFGGEISERLHDIRTDLTILSARDAASIFLYGGTVATGLVEITDSAVMTIFGTNFTVDGIPVAYGPLAMSNGLLEGVLQSGDALLGNPFLTTGGGQIVLAAPVPEPGTGVLVGLGLVGLTAYRRRLAKKRV